MYNICGNNSIFIVFSNRSNNLYTYISMQEWCALCSILYTTETQNKYYYCNVASRRLKLVSRFEIIYI